MMKSSGMMVWALGQLEFRQPVSFEDAPDFFALQCAPPAALRLRFRSYCDGDPRRIVDVPMDLLLRADDESERVSLTIEPAIDLYPGGAACVLELAAQANSLGGGCAAWHDAARKRLVLQSRICHLLEFRRTADTTQAASIQKQMTSNWLEDAVKAGVRVSIELSRRLGAR